MSNTIAQNLEEIKSQIPKNVLLVAVSKTKPSSYIQEAYDAGQLHFGENKAQEVTEKAPALPEDIKWHFIGHLQSKKVKQIISHTHLIHSVDSLKLLTEIDKRAHAIHKVQDVLLQMHIAQEESKFGLVKTDLNSLITKAFSSLKNIRITGLMGMATFSDDQELVKSEFDYLKSLFNKVKKTHFANEPSFQHISMGMSGDYPLAISCGSTMVRIGSSIFGSIKKTSSQL